MKLLATLTLALAGVFGFLYVLQVNSLTALAYHMGEYEAEKIKLSDHNTILETSATHIFSINNLEHIAFKMNFEKVHDVSYLKIAEPAVAKSK